MRQPLSAMGYIKKVYETTENNSEELSSSNSGDQAKENSQGGHFSLTNRIKKNSWILFWEMSGNNLDIGVEINKVWG